MFFTFKSLIFPLKFFFMRRQSVYLFTSLLFFVFLLFLPALLKAQAGFEWNKAGDGYYLIQGGEIVEYSLPQRNKIVLVSKSQLTRPARSRWP